MERKNHSPAPTRIAKTQEVRAYAESMREHLVAAIAAGGDTDRKVASILNKQKLRTRTGDRWSFGGVKYLCMLLGIARQLPKQSALTPAKVNDDNADEALELSDRPTAVLSSEMQEG
jgi:hypothetical protein